MFFKRDYSTPGPGIDPSAPEKTGIARFIQILELECVTLLKLNLLFLLTCLPIVTIPPAVFAMNQVVRRMVLDKPVYCFYHYRRAFKKFWKTAYAAFFTCLLPVAVSGVGALFYLQRALHTPLLLAPFVLCSTVFLCALLGSTYFYGLLSLGHRLGESATLALKLGLGRPLRAVLAALSYYGTIAVAVLEFPISALYLLLIGFSLPCLLGNFYIRTVLRQFGTHDACDEDL